MKTITCRKCGATIDAELGECPNCGAVYYILPEEGKAPDLPAQDTNAAWDPLAPTQDLDVAGASSDDIFNTSVWKTIQDPDETRAFRPAQQPQQPVRQHPPQQPNRRQPRASAQQSRERSARPPEPPVKKGLSARKKSLIVAAIALLAVLVLVISIMSGAFDFSKNSEKLTMPRVISFPIETARNVLENMGLEVNTQNEHDSSSAGTVIAQSIKENKVVKEGDKVMLTVSLGPDEDTSASIEEVTVPYLIGKTYDQAVRELDNLGLLVTSGESQYSDKAEGTVITQNPSQGSIVQKGDMVLIIVSKGLEPSPSPTAYAISVTSGSGGTVTPKGLVAVNENEDMTFTITPAEGYEIREVKVDGVDVGAVSSYTFTNVTDDHTLYVVFRVKTETPTPSPSPSQQPTDTLAPVE